jgi:hypothetical protein
MRPEVIRGDEITPEQAEKIMRKREQLMERLARGLETEAVDWSPTEGDEDLGKERRLHLKSATAGLKELLRKQPAGPEPGSVTWEVENGG